MTRQPQFDIWDFFAYLGATTAICGFGWLVFWILSHLRWEW